MNIIYDGLLIDESDFKVEISNRAFQYGDGLFESIIYDNGNLRFFDRHLSRLYDAMECLSLKKPKQFQKHLELNIKDLLVANRCSNAKLKLQVWRKSGGLYSPENNDIHYVIYTSTWTDKSHVLDRVGFSEEHVLSYSKYSSFKTCNSLPYILATIERDKRQLSDLILCDVNGNISEATSSNIFWKKNEIYYTPHLETGCVAGIMRSVLLDKLTESGCKILEVKAQKQELDEADQLFLCNVSGLYPVSRLNNVKYHTILDDVILDCIKKEE